MSSGTLGIAINATNGWNPLVALTRVIPIGVIFNVGKDQRGRMKNKAKCKLCNSIIESYFKDDYVECKCREIAIAGGDYEFWSRANDYANFLRIDDEGNEVHVKFGSKEEKESTQNPFATSPFEELCRMIEADEKLPEKALYQPVNYFDLLRYAVVMREALKKYE